MSGLLNELEKIPNPCFVIDESLFERNMQCLHKLEQCAGVNILCALKGFAMWEVFPLAMQYISGGTASSLNEVKLIADKMNRKAHSCFVVYTEEEFDTVNSMSSHITFNSLNQYEKFKGRLKENVKYGIRINPDFSTVEVDYYNPCKPGSRFGITSDLMGEHLPLGVTGIHFHMLCESSAEDFEQALETIEKQFGHLLHQAEWVNFGGGHHITKEGYNIDLLTVLIQRIKQRYAVEVFLEPGEAIGLNTGYLISKVEDVVTAHSVHTAILNVSFAAHMPDCLEMPYKPCVINEEPSGTFHYRLGGNTCMSGDYVEGFTFEKPLRIGDVIVFEDMVHYTFVKTNFFNGVQHPCLGVWTKECDFKLLREFVYEDYRDRLS